MRNNIFTKKYIEIGLHLLFWVVYFSYPIIKFGDHQGFVFNFTEAIRGLLFISGFVYITLYFLKRGKIKFVNIVSLISFLFLVIYFNCYFYVQDCQCDIKVCFLNKLVEFLLITSFFVAMYMIKRNIINHQKLQKIEKENIAAELKSLRAQVNPHFLFNTLNMLYSNAFLKDKELADKILKLSDSLHYLMHEGNKDKVTIAQEIEFINGYIDLQKSRINDKVAVQFTKEIDNEKQLIPPLLLIPFIENAFKYSSMVEGKNNPIIINLQLKKGNFYLYVENRFDKAYSSKQSKKWKESGIGLNNVKKRLNLLFPKPNHKLNIDDDNGIYKVNLKINLK